MGRVINITDKLSTEKPIIQIGEDSYPVNDSMEVVLKFQELTGDETSLKSAVELALGKTAAKKIKVEEMSVSNFKVLITAIMAAMQGMTFDEAASRFQV